MSERQKEYYWWSFLLFVFLIPISQFLSVRILVVLLLFSFFIRTQVRFSDFTRYSWDVFLFVAVLLFGLLYTEDYRAGFANIETSFSLLAIPLVLFRVSEVDETKVKMTSYAFASGLLVASLVCLVNAAMKYASSADPKAFLYYEFTDILHTQPTYFAYYLTFVITAGVYLLFYGKTKVNPWLMGLAILFFFSMLLLTGGRTAYVSLLLVFSFFILKFFLEDKTATKNLVFIMVVVMIGSMFYVSSRDLKATGAQNTEGDHWERLVLWESALQAAAPHLVAGVGTGDYQNLLNDYYISHGLPEYASSNMNSHNQFIQILFSNGILGIFALLVMLCRPLYFSVRNDYILGTLAMFAFLLYGLTEVFLGRYSGVVLYALLHQLFAAHYRSLTPVFSLK